MKRLKVTSVMLSAAMCMSMVMTPVSVMADEAAPEETQVEETEKQETKETEKAAAEETQKPSANETEKQEPEAVEDKVLDDEDSAEAVDAVLAKGKCGKKLNWSLSNTGVLTISGKGVMYAYTKPDQTKPVPWKAHADKITKVVISKGVTTVGSYAFYNCANLTSVSLPKTLKAINAYAFAYCKGLTKVVIPSKVTTIGIAAFRNCGSLVSVNIPKGVTKINDYTFNQCTSLKSISIPATVKTIGNYAFNLCSKLTGVSIAKGVTVIGDNAFRQCSELTAVVIPVTVKSIGNNAFFKCTKLVEVNIPVSGLNSIGKSAFSGDTALASFNIPLSVTYIGDSAFYNCTSLAQVWISPTQKANAPQSAFAKCSKLNYIEHEFLVIGNQFSVGVFSYAVSNPAIDGTGTVDLIAIGFDVEKAVIPAVAEYNGVTYRVTKISRYTSQYNNQRKLKYLVIGANVVTIEDESFAGCPELVSVTGGVRLRTIGSRAFERCPKLKVFNITSKTLWKIGPFAFNGDRVLTTLNFKKTIKIVKSGVRNSLKGSSVKTVKVKKKKLKKYKKIFKKKIVGKKVKVKK